MHFKIHCESKISRNTDLYSTSKVVHTNEKLCYGIAPIFSAQNNVMCKALLPQDDLWTDDGLME